ncbi:MAG: methyltransferase [Firmicutes bacterium]|nr:methyltransferase [Bacillota bacterium]
MTHRERFRAAVTHGRPDRAVFDLCGSPQTDVDDQTVKDELAALLGITGEKRGDYNLDERILIALDIDTRRVGGMPTPRTAFCREEAGVCYDSFGIGYRRINGHGEICHNPLKGRTLAQVEDYPLPDPSRADASLIEKWAEKGEFLHTQTDYAVVAEHPVFGVFELGCWMFGFDDFLFRFAAEPEVVHAFFSRVLDYQKQVIAAYYGALGPYIDCTTSGDDFGTQKAPFMSAGMFDEMIAPYFAERVRYTKRFTKAFFKHHTCGSVFGLLPSLIACGVEILNPIQPGAAMMEPERLKENFGDKLAFWGGVDTQRLLPAGSAGEIKTEVKRILSVLDKDGGYILSPAHTIQRDVPAGNLLAVYEGGREYYGNLTEER